MLSVVKAVFEPIMLVFVNEELRQSTINCVAPFSMNLSLKLIKAFLRVKEVKKLIYLDSLFVKNTNQVLLTPL